MLARTIQDGSNDNEKEAEKVPNRCGRKGKVVGVSLILERTNMLQNGIRCQTSGKPYSYTERCTEQLMWMAAYLCQMQTFLQKANKQIESHFQKICIKMHASN